MALLECKVFAESLGMATTVTVILPQQTVRQIGLAGVATDTRSENFRGHPTLYLLHGLSDDHSIWLRRTSIERYVAPLGIAVVMPEVHRSFYTDMAHGQRYFMYVSEELPRMMRSFFRLSPRREDTYVAGLSMGGYGAFKMALTNPDEYAGAASLSGAIDINWCSRERLDLLPDYSLVFGDLAKLPGSKNDLFHLASTLRERCDKKGVDLPRLFFSCGDQDHLLSNSHAMKAHLESLDVPFTYEQHAGYNHAWDYWDFMMPRVLEWMGAGKGPLA